MIFFLSDDYGQDILKCLFQMFSLFFKRNYWIKGIIGKGIFNRVNSLSKPV